VGVTDLYGVTINNQGGGISLVSVSVSRGSVKIDRITVDNDPLPPSAPSITGATNGTTYTAAITPTWTDATGTTSTATLDGAPYAR